LIHDFSQIDLALENKDEYILGAKHKKPRGRELQIDKNFSVFLSLPIGLASMLFESFVPN